MFHAGNAAIVNVVTRSPAINLEKGVYPFPQEVSFEEAGFTAPFARVLRGQRMARLK